MEDQIESFASILEDAIYQLECAMGTRPKIIRMPDGIYPVMFEDVKFYLTKEQKERLLS